MKIKLSINDDKEYFADIYINNKWFKQIGGVSKIFEIINIILNDPELGDFNFNDFIDIEDNLYCNSRHKGEHLTRNNIWLCDQCRKLIKQ